MDRDVKGKVLSFLFDIQLIFKHILYYRVSFDFVCAITSLVGEAYMTLLLCRCGIFKHMLTVLAGFYFISMSQSSYDKI